MLQEFRKFSKAFLYIVIAAFVGTIIFAWGADVNRPKGQKGIIGEIDGEEIDYQIYSRIVDNYYQQASRSSQREISSDEMLEIRNRAWVDLVTDIVNRHIYERLGLTLTNVELAEHMKRFPPQFIQQHPEFQTEQGTFDYQKYLSTMQDPRFEQFWVELEALSRNDLVTLKLQEIAVTGGRVTSEDVKEEFIDKNEQIKLEYALILADQQDDPEIVNDSSDVIEYYNSHQDRYYKGAEASLNYVEFKKEPTESDSLALREDIQSILDELKDGSDFALLAQNISEDGSAQNGGDLGWFGKGAMVQEFEEAAFALADSGDLSEPVKTQFGWHIILKTGERETDDGKKEIHASHILMKFKPSGQTITDLSNAAQSLIEEAGNVGFETAAKNLGFEVLNSGDFTEGTYCGGIGQSVNSNIFAFSHDVDELSTPIEEAGRFLVVQVAGYKQASIRSIEESYGRANSDLRQKLLFDRAFEKAKQIHDLVLGDKSLEQVAEDIGAEFYTTNMISRKNPVRKLGRDPYFLGRAFRLTEESPLSEPIMTGKGAAVLRLLERQAPNLEAFTSAQDSIMQRMTGEGRQRAYQAWFRTIQEQHEIKDYREELYGTY